MLKRDFISKIIEQIVNAIARLLKVDHEKETEKFIIDFDELLQTYYHTSLENLELLTEAEDKRDSFLLDEKLKTTQLNLFARAGLAFLIQGNQSKAETCLKIIDRVKNQNSDLFEFPSEEAEANQRLIDELRSKLDGTYFNESN